MRILSNFAIKLSSWKIKNVFENLMYFKKYPDTKMAQDY